VEPQGIQGGGQENAAPGQIALRQGAPDGDGGGEETAGGLGGALAGGWFLLPVFGTGLAEEMAGFVQGGAEGETPVQGDQVQEIPVLGRGRIGLM
jgi:hypothetical protein